MRCVPILTIWGCPDAFRRPPPTLPLAGGGQWSLVVTPAPTVPPELPGHIPRPRRDVEVPTGRLRHNGVAMAAGATGATGARALQGDPSRPTDPHHS